MHTLHNLAHEWLDRAMAFPLPNLSPLTPPCKRNERHPHVSPPAPPRSGPLPHSLTPLQLTNLLTVASDTKLNPTSVRGAQVKEPPGAHDNQKNDFYVNLGLAVRTLRDDVPRLFTKDLNYDIYRDDITFIDPLNTFSGIEKYKLIFWALRFHGRILFREIDLEVLRIWQPSENMILIRWNLRGVPRVPWEAKGEFQGTSRYKLDRNGKIYEHKVDNLAVNFPRALKQPVTVLDLVTATPASPNLTFFCAPAEEYSSSWVEFYRAVKETLDHHHQGKLHSHDGLVICS